MLISFRLFSATSICWEIAGKINSKAEGTGVTAEAGSAGTTRGLLRVLLLEVLLMRMKLLERLVKQLHMALYPVEPLLLELS